MLTFGALAMAGGAAERPAPKYLGGSQPDQAEGERILATFRNVGIQGAYWLRFELRVLPRQGDERTLQGEMFGAPDQAGPLTRLVVDDPGKHGGSHEQRYLLRSGPGPVAWSWYAGERGITPYQLAPDRWLEPVRGTDLTLFDLLMPFLRWTDHAYEGVANVRGRPAHSFLLYPPAGFPPQGPAAVRVHLDTQFSALTQAEWLDAAGKPLKTVTVLDLKQTGGQWIVKSIDLRNHRTRAKTRFSLTAAALGLTLPSGLFAPENLSGPAPSVPGDKVERF